MRDPWISIMRIASCAMLALCISGLVYWLLPKSYKSTATFILTFLGTIICCFWFDDRQRRRQREEQEALVLQEIAAAARRATSICASDPVVEIERAADLVIKTEEEIVLLQ